eukprot:Nitzschia sp. Nitz4//scaffold7_size249615//3714//4439//NITZ4_001133-RA/size249615-processed-gene-0.124-mRNA-1//1//CDS//3329558310//8255//frame0
MMIQPRASNQIRGRDRQRASSRPDRKKSIERKNAVLSSLSATLGDEVFQIGNDGSHKLEEAATSAVPPPPSHSLAKSHVVAGAFSPALVTRKAKLNAEEPNATTSGAVRMAEATPTSVGFARQPSLNQDNMAELLEENKHTEQVTVKTPLRSALKKSGRITARKSVRTIAPDCVAEISKSVLTHKKMSEQGVRFEDTVDSKRISKIRMSVIDDLFYNSMDLADFRQEAFLEECGLDPAEFM